MHHPKKKLFQKLIAVLMTMALFCSLAIPSFAVTETKAVSTAAAKKTVFLGDSRTANLRQTRMGGDLIYDLIQQDGNVVWDFKWGAHFTDMVFNLVPRLETSGVIDSKTRIVIWMGYNDAAGTPTATAGDYVNYLNLMTALWTARGASVYIMNVGPSGCKPGQTSADKTRYKSNNKKIKAFNQTIKEGLTSQATYLDCYSYLVKNGYSTSDGTHYNNATSRKVYSFAMNRLK